MSSDGYIHETGTKYTSNKVRRDWWSGLLNKQALKVVVQDHEQNISWVTPQMIDYIRPRVKGGQDNFDRWSAEIDLPTAFRTLDSQKSVRMRREMAIKFEFLKAQNELMQQFQDAGIDIALSVEPEFPAIYCSLRGSKDEFPSNPKKDLLRESIGLLKKIFGIEQGQASSHGMGARVLDVDKEDDQLLENDNAWIANRYGEFAIGKIFREFNSTAAKTLPGFDDFANEQVLVYSVRKRAIIDGASGDDPFELEADLKDAYEIKCDGDSLAKHFIVFRNPELSPES